MEYVCDLHLHSRYSRAVSPAMNLPEMAKWAKLKGLHILSSADFTHPLWRREMKNQLIEGSEGVYTLKNGEQGVRFLLSTEIACIYKQGEKLRRIHNLLFAPNFEAVEKLTEALLKRGCNLSADGRPIIGMSSKDLLEMALTIDKRMILIPAHVWTPHFGMYGSASGFDSLHEAFGDLDKFIYGIETGLSSDPLMNWQIPELDNRSILSFSDAHSAPKMGREATVMHIEKSLDAVTYMDIGKVIAGPAKRKLDDRKSTIHSQSSSIAYTIEFYPEEGKYHYTGHRNCSVSKTPEEIKKDGTMCPVCNRRLTEGVMVRVEQIGGENAEFKIQNSEFDKNGVFWIKDPKGIHPPFVKLVPLNEIIAESVRSPVGSEKVKQQFVSMCQSLGDEITILLKTPLSAIESRFGEKIAEGVSLVRKGGITVIPGFDGEYGKVRIWHEEKETKPADAKAMAGKGQNQLGLDF